MNRNIRSVFTVFAATAAIATIAFADEEAPKYPEVSLTFGGTINDGNTEDESANAAFDYKNVRGGYEYTFNAGGNITRTTTTHEVTNDDGTTSKRKEKETTAKNGEVKGKILIPVAEPFSAYVDASAFRDEVADIDYRIMVGPGVAWDVYKSDTLGVRLELGIAPLWEKTDGETENYTVLRFGERIEKTFASGAKIWEEAEYLPAIDDSDKYLINAEAGVESPLNDKLSLRVVLKDKYNSLPADDHEKNDLSLIVGVRVKL